MSPDSKRILLVEDSPQDVELTLAAFKEIHLTNEVFVVHDGAGSGRYPAGAGRFFLNYHSARAGRFSMRLRRTSGWWSNAASSARFTSV